MGSVTLSYGGTAGIAYAYGYVSVVKNCVNYGAITFCWSSPGGACWQYLWKGSLPQRAH